MDEGLRIEGWRIDWAGGARVGGWQRHEGMRDVGWWMTDEGWN